MKSFASARLRFWAGCISPLILAAVLAPPTRASVTNVVWYRLGENDPGAASGLAATNATDVLGVENLFQFGSPHYTNGISTAASNNVGSFLAVQFNGTNQYFSNSPVSLAVDNFGIEAWVKPDTTAGGTHIIAFNGNAGSVASANGWGLSQVGATYFGALGAFTTGLTTFGSGTATAGTWTHLALVHAGGVATLYVNGVASGTIGFTPDQPAGGFAIGSFPQAPTGQYFSGSIDEVRVFTFGTGSLGFSTNDLLINLQRVVTVGVSNALPTSAILVGVGGPAGLPSTAWFEWGTTTNYGNVTPAQSLSVSATSPGFFQGISNLLFGTTYQFHAVLSNKLGLVTGANQSFTTAGPSVQTLPATGVDATVATLNGTGNPSGASLWFQWGTTTNYGNLTPAQVVTTGGASFSQGLTGLSPNTTYQFSAVVSNNIGTVIGSNQTFTTLSPLTATTLAASGVGTNSATLNGTANSGGANTIAYFEFGTTTNYGTITANQTLGSGSNGTNFSQFITGLAGGVTYHFHAVATRNGSIAPGADQTFTTLALPFVATLPASAVTASNATLNGSVTPNGWATTVWFIWGVAGNNNNATPPQSVGSSTNTTGTNFSQALTGLVSGTQYSFQAVASNAAGVVFGVNQNFSPPFLPTVNTLPASGVDVTVATLNGATPLGSTSSGTVWFQWGTTTNYGNLTPAQVVGSGGVAFNQTLTNVSPNTTYQFSAVISNNAGLVTGSNLSFTTLWPLTATTSAASGVGTNSATLNGAANPGGSNALGYFQYGTTTNYGTITANQNLGFGTNSTNFSQPLTGLASGVTYHFQAVATRNGSVAFGADQTFTTPTLPVVTTLPVSGPGLTNATLNGSAVPNGSATTVWFIWGVAPNNNNVTPLQSAGSSISSSTNFSQALTGLTSGTQYSFQAVASNAAGVVFGAVQFFTTPVLPTVNTLPATGVDVTLATLNGTANPGGDGPGTVWFQWGTTTNYGNLTPAQVVTTGGASFNQVLTNLSGNTTYQFSAVISNNVGAVTGSNLSFTTLEPPPVTTLPANPVGASTATLNGSAIPNGTLTIVWFEWGPDFDNATPPQVVGSGTNSTNFSHVISGLIGGTSYSYRAVALNSEDVFFGADQNFTTLLPPGVTTLPAAVTNTSVALNGAANPNGTDTAAWFEWGSTTNYGNVIAAQDVGSGVGSGNTNFFQVLTGLTGGDYQCRAVVSNSVAVAVGSNQTFTVSAFILAVTNLPGYYQASAAWGDFDNDGRLDIQLGGAVLASNPTFDHYSNQLWLNTTVGFSNINAALPLLTPLFSAWGDYDNDGQLDLLLSGENTLFTSVVQIWRNANGQFSNVNAIGSGAPIGSGAWGDYDNDGRLDLVLTGFDSARNNFITQVWRNTGNGFANVNANLPGVFGTAVWGDYDNDGRLDILLAGVDNTGTNVITQVWRNTGNGFTNINANLPGVFAGTAVWGDYDNDGRLDILLSGSDNTGTNLITQVWRNTGNGFSNINAGLPGVFKSCVAWGDYNNDGRLDILVAGDTNEFDLLNQVVNKSNLITQVWRNTGNGFSNINAGFPGVVGTVAWGDYDNDGRLDILLSGVQDELLINTPNLGKTTLPSNYLAQIWRNNSPQTNTVPTAPSGLRAVVAGANVAFSWNAASDAQTPAAGLTYNLRVGTTPGGGDIVGPMAAASGQRRLPQMGNVQETLSRTMSLPMNQPIYWSVQAVDTAFAGGPFAPERQFTLGVSFTPSNGVPVPGDTDGDGIVSQSELAAVLANLNGNGIVNQSELDLVLSHYFPNSPFLLLTNVVGLGGTNVTFGLSNSTAGAFSVQYSTDLVNWQFLGPATPQYLFTDTNAAGPQRFYRLRWP
jgi:hypothetical protein